LSVLRYKKWQNVLKDMNKRFLESGNCEATESFCRIDMRWVRRLEVVINMRKIRGSWDLHCTIGERSIIRPIRTYGRMVARCGTVVDILNTPKPLPGDIGGTVRLPPFSTENPQVHFPAS
jgi:hypothetical protein